MSCPRWCFTFEFEYLTGEWSFVCIYADDLDSAKKEFEKIPSGLYSLKSIDRKDNFYTGKDKRFEPEVRLYNRV